MRPSETETAATHANHGAHLPLPTVAAFQANLAAAIEQIADRLGIPSDQAEQLAFAGMAVRRHRRGGAAFVVRELASLANEFVDEANAESCAARN